MAKAFHSKLRKKISTKLQKVLSTLFSFKTNTTPIELESIHKILVVRINYRIGNILFMTPLLNALEKEFPNAKIDMIVGASFTKPLIQEMPQINHVYDFPRKLLKQPLKLLKFKKFLNQEKYDLIINPNPNSSSNGFFTLLIKSKYKIGFEVANKFTPLTHSMPFPKEVTHEALRPLLLMQLLSKKDTKFNQTLDIRLTQKEKASEKVTPNTIGIFRDARGNKKIDNSWWSLLLEKLKNLDNSLNFIDILDPNNTTSLNKTIKTLSKKNLRTLSANIANLDAFICGDTGPMHLSSASQTPTIALFKTTSPLYYGTLGEKDLSLILKDKSIENIAKEILMHLKKVKNNEI